MTASTRRILQAGVIFFLTAGTSIRADQDRSPVREIDSSSHGLGSPPSNVDVAEATRLALSRSDRYRIRSGDTLELTFILTPEFSQTVTVRPDGFITLRGRTDLRVDGLTTPELRHKLQEAYAGLLREPVMTVDLKDFEKPYFIALGEFTKPGKYDLRGNTTVSQALGIAGGFNDAAKLSQVLLFRGVSPEWVEVKALDMKQMLRHDGTGEDPQLRNGDMIFVPRTFVSRIKNLIPWVAMGLHFWW